MPELKHHGRILDGGFCSVEDDGDVISDFRPVTEQSLGTVAEIFSNGGRAILTQAQVDRWALVANK